MSIVNLSIDTKDFSMKQFRHLSLLLSLFIATGMLFPFTGFGKSFVMCAHSPHDISKSPISVYFLGFKIDLGEGPALLPDCDATPCDIIIGYVSEFTSRENNVKYLKRESENPYLWFSLQLSADREASTENFENPIVYKWTVTKRNPDKMSLRVPEKAIVILMDPSLVEDLQDTESISTQGSIQLPTIKIKQSVTKEQLNDALSIAAIIALDLDTIHRKDASGARPSALHLVNRNG